MAFASAAGEPFRALAGLDIREGLVAKAFYFRPVGAPAGFSDRSPWEVQEGGLTLALEVAQPFADAFVNPPTRIYWQVAVPAGGAAVGAARSVALTAAGDLPATQAVTIRFDTDPIANSAANAIRAGQIELYLKVERTGTAADWSVDTRGNLTGAAAGATPTITGTLGRGYVRARSKLAAYKASRVALGSDDNDFAYKDTTLNRATLDAVLYRAEPVTLEHRNGASTIHTQADAASTAVDRDFSWSATSGATSRIHGAGSGSGGAYPLGQAGVRAILPVRDFGGDNETAWADSGHAAGFTVTDGPAAGSGGRTVDHPTRLTTDPRVTVTHHLQLNQPVFALAQAVPSFVRLREQQGNVWVCLANKRAESLALTGGADGRITHSLLDAFGSVRAQNTDRPTGALTDGVRPIDTSILWDHALPGGTWVSRASATDGAGAQQLSGADQNMVLLAVDAQVVVTAESDRPGRHFTAGRPLTLTLAMVRADNDPRITPDTAAFALVRFTAAGQEHWTGTVWALTGAGQVTWLAAAAHPADARAFRLTITDTAGWGDQNVLVIGRAGLSGSFFADQAHLELLGVKNPHDVYEFDPTGLLK